MRAQLHHRVLGRLGLQLAGRAEVRQQRDVDVQHVVAADILAHLADGLQERQALDIADRAADLDDHDIGAGWRATRGDAPLDLVGDMRDDLDRAAQVIAAPLLLDHR